MARSRRRSPDGARAAPPPAPVVSDVADPSTQSVTVSLGTPEARTHLAWAVGLLAFLVGILWLAANVRSVTVPLAVAFVMAYALDPVVDRFEARRIPRTVAILILLVGFVVTLTLLVVLLGPQVAQEFQQVPDKVRQALDKLIPWVESTFKVETPHNVRDAMETLKQRLVGIDVKAMVAPAGNVLTVLYGSTVGVLSGLAGTLLIPLFAFYLLRDFDLIVARAGELIPPRHRPPVGSIFHEIDVAMGSFIRGQLTVASVLALLYALGLWAVGLPLALLVGLIAGFGNMIPYVGTTVGVVLATLMAVLDWGGVGHLLMVYAVFVVVQGLEGWIITPMIVGESVGLSPFLVMVAILVFGDLFGFLGILVAVPSAAILKILMRALVDRYQSSAFFRAA
ncbi:MAG: AI-2E family transporter [Myxococcota bacterium]